jgi:hypothetical protein
MKFTPQGIGNKRQTAAYQNVKDYIIQLWCRRHSENRKDVANLLRKAEKIDMAKNMPRKMISQEMGADHKTRRICILYKAEIDMYTKRKHELQDNMNKTYSLIFLQHCHKAIQDRITGHPELKSKN